MKPKQVLALSCGLAESLNPGFMESAFSEKKQKPKKSEAQQRKAMELAKQRRERRNLKRANAFHK